MTALSQDPFAGPIQTLREFLERTNQELSQQQHQGAVRERLEQMIAEHQNAIDTLEALRE
jgi:hypothetical protein